MKGQQELDVTGMIFDHVGDSYYWHLTDVGETSVSMPLPVLVFSKHTGWHAFSSARFHHGHKTCEGLAIAPEESPNAGKIIEVATGERPALDLSITKNVAGLLIVSVLLCLMVIGTARWYKRRDVTDAAPKGFIGSMEMMVNFVYEDIIKANVPEHTARYTPYLLTVFFFIFLTNLLGLVPGSANLTGNIAVTVTLALFTFTITNIFGTKAYWQEVFWNPELPAWLRPLMAVIEFISLFTKPFSLTIRLFANILAGHCALLGVLSVIFLTAVSMPGGGNYTMSAVSLLLAIFLDMMEVLVAFIQAFVFTMLSSIYIGLSQVHHHHE
jgi:F-type H+-transporting ATPase subunit a